MKKLISSKTLCAILPFIILSNFFTGLSFAENTLLTTTELSTLETAGSLTTGYNYWDTLLKLYKKAIAPNQLQTLSFPSESVKTSAEITTLKSSNQIIPNLLYWNSETKTYEQGTSVSSTSPINASNTRKNTTELNIMRNAKTAIPDILYWDTSLKQYFKGQADNTLLPFSLGNQKTITITFDSTPTTWSVTKAPLKYNKDFAWSFVMDDGYQEAYLQAFKYFNGGSLEKVGIISPGKYFTDGTGNDVPFKGSYAIFSQNSSFENLHDESSLSFLRWSQIDESLDAGWDLLHHGFTGLNSYNNLTTEVVGGKDYVTSHTASGYVMQHAIIPGGMSAAEDEAFNDACFANGIKSIMRNGDVFTFDGTDHLTTGSGDKQDVALLTTSADLEKYYQSRFYYADDSYTTETIKNHVNDLAATSINGAHYWSIDFTHRVLEPGSQTTLSGNLSWEKFQSLIDHVEDTYGKDGNDTAWVASSQEVYEYLASRNASVVSSELVGSTLTITVDAAAVPNELRRKALSLLINADTNIQSISYSNDAFTYTSENTSTGLINLDWDTNFTNNLSTHVEYYVAQAETTKAQTHANLAQTWIDFMDAGTEKTAFQSRLDVIDIEGQKWQVSFGENSTTQNIWNTFGLTASGGSLNDIYDSVGDETTVDINITQSFTSKSSSGATTGNDTGIVPDDALAQHIRMYGNDQPTGILQIAGLLPAETYNIVLVGSDTNTANDTTTTTEYLVNGATKTLQTSNNTGSSVSFNALSPNTSGEITVSVQPQANDTWAYGVLNAMVIQIADPGSSSCSDGVQNGNETGTDCGGSCSACPTCFDGTQNQDETGIDCGGATCSACITCDDGVQNQGEEGIDCGGPCDACSAVAQTWRIDVGAGGREMSTSGWNDIISYSTGSSLTDIVDINNTSTAVDLTITDGFHSSNNGGVVTDTGVYPQMAQLDTFYLYGGGDNVGQVTLSDLNPAKQYSIRLFGSRSSAAPRQSEFTIGATSVILESSFNTNDTVMITDISPSAGGDIVIDVTVPTTGNTYGGYLGVIELMEQL